MTPSYRHRQRQIAEVLVRYEMGHLLEIFGLERFVSLERRLLRRGAAHTRPESLRLALEELGPTFIKLGQALSTRADLLPPDFQAELASSKTTPIASRLRSSKKPSAANSVCQPPSCSPASTPNRWRPRPSGKSTPPPSTTAPR